MFIHTHLCQCMTESSKIGDMQRHATILRVYWKNPQDPVNNEEFEYNHGNLAIFGCPKSYHLRPHQSWPKWTMLKASAGIQAKCDEIDLIHIIYNILIYIIYIYICFTFWKMCSIFGFFGEFLNQLLIFGMTLTLVHIFCTVPVAESTSKV